MDTPTGDTRPPADGDTPTPSIVMGGITFAPTKRWKAAFRPTPNEGDAQEDGDVEDQHAQWVFLDVLAFDAQGNALVMDAKLGALVPANGYSNFEDLRDSIDEDDAQFVAFLPGDGWQITYGATPEAARTSPVVAWGLAHNGDAHAIHIDRNAHADYVWAAGTGAAEGSDYAHIRYTPPAQSTPTPHAQQRNGGRRTLTPNGRTPDAHVGAEVDAHVGVPVAAYVGGTGHAQPETGGRPKKAPSGRKPSTPKGTPTVDDLTPTLRERLAQLGAEYPAPTPIPGRDTVIKHMADRGIPGFTNKPQVDVLIRVLRADRERFPSLAVGPEVPA